MASFERPPAVITRQAERTALPARGREGYEARVGRALYRYLRMVAATASCSWVDADGNALAAGEGSRAVVTAETRDRPLVVTYWIRDCLGLATVPFLDDGFAAAVRSYRCLVDDTIGGRIASHFIRAVGAQCTLVALPGDPARLAQLQRVIASGGVRIFPVDGGGPYCEVGTGIVGLASTMAAPIVPLAVHASRAVTFPHRSRFRLPLPGTRLTVAVGAVPEVLSRRADRRDAALTLKRTLDHLAGVTRRPF